MPIIEIERLSKDSDDTQAKAAISSCIKTEMDNGREQQQAIAMCYSMVEGKIERKLPQGGK